MRAKSIRTCSPGTSAFDAATALPGPRAASDAPSAPPAPITSGPNQSTARTPSAEPSSGTDAWRVRHSQST